MQVEILYLAWNRLEFTRASFGLLVRNTDWAQVDRLIVYDDTSEDGTDRYLQAAGAEVPVPAFEFRQVNFNSPPAVMNDYLALTEADLFAKIDNDIAVPPGWLDAMLSVFERHDQLQLLGMEAARTGPPVKQASRYAYERSTHIGGVGVMRTRFFHTRPAIPAHGRFGFTEWQFRHQPELGWIVPDLRVCQLDRLPFKPWTELSAKYVQKGWQRNWPKYDTLQPWWWEWLRERQAAA